MAIDEARDDRDDGAGNSAAEQRSGRGRARPRGRPFTAATAREAAQASQVKRQPHPLFPAREGEKVPDIAWITLSRREAGVGWVSCPRPFPAKELESNEDITSFFGGGAYELRGHLRGPDGRPGFIASTVHVTLPGEPIPFAGRQQGDAVARATVDGQRAQHQDGSILTFMLESARLDRQEQRDREERQREREQREREDERRRYEAQRAEEQRRWEQQREDDRRRYDAERAAEAQRTQMMLNVLTNRGPDPIQQIAAIAQVLKPAEGTTGVGALREVLGLAKELAPKPPEAPTESIGDVLQGIGAIAPLLQQMKPNGGQGGAPAAPVVAANPLAGLPTPSAAAPAPVQAPPAAPATMPAPPWNPGEAGGLET